MTVKKPTIEKSSRTLLKYIKTEECESEVNLLTWDYRRDCARLDVREKYIHIH